MTVRQIIEWMGSIPNGGYLTNESRLDSGFMTELINSGRVAVLNQRWRADRDIPRSYYLEVTPTYNKLAQEDACCVTYYDLPAMVALDGLSTGMGYVGTIDGMPCQFREVGSLAEFASMQLVKTMKVDGRNTYVLPDGQGGIRVYSSTAVKSFMMEIIPANPIDVPTFNIDIDRYPMAIDDLSLVANYLTSGGLSLAYRTPIDKVADGNDAAAPMLPRQ